MSLPSNPLPDPLETTPPPIADNPVLEAPPVTAAPLEKPFPAWKFRDVVAVLVFTLVAILVCTVAALFIARSFPQYRNASLAEMATNAIIVIGAQTAAYPLVLLFIFVLVRTRSRQSFSKAIQWHWPASRSLVFVIGGMVLALVVDGLARYLPIPKSLPMDAYFKDPVSAYLMAAFGVTLAPLLEEVFFRGLLYPLLGRAFGVVTGVVLTAAAFAAIHGAQLGYAWAPVLSIFIVGVVFTVVRVRSNSVAASLLMHCGYNLALFSALWFFSDHFRHLEKVTS